MTKKVKKVVLFCTIILLIITFTILIVNITKESADFIFLPIENFNSIQELEQIYGVKAEKENSDYNDYYFDGITVLGKKADLRIRGTSYKNLMYAKIIINVSDYETEKEFDSAYEKIYKHLESYYDNFEEYEDGKGGSFDDTYKKGTVFMDILKGRHIEFEYRG